MSVTNQGEDRKSRESVLEGGGDHKRDSAERGCLFVVSTPIGNLEDITLRAIRVLREVDLIAAEDTRRTAKLLAHYNIQTQTTSYHDHNKTHRTPNLLKRLRRGLHLAVVSDAGTPGVSDPCYYLVTRAVDEGIPVIPIPGPTAAVSAVVVSGLPTDRFVFEGFLPVKEGRCRARLLELSAEKRTIIMYESPHRLLRHLTMMREVWGDRKMAVARELTKRFEEVQRGTISHFVDRYHKVRPKGEFVLIIEGASEERAQTRRCCPAN